MTAPFNLLIVGVGGQGVATLARVLWILCSRKSLPCHGSIVKGGAQRLGTVLATLRIFPEGVQDHFLHSPEIPPGELDLLIGLEPWEALRQQKYFKESTFLLVHEKPVAWRAKGLETSGLTSPLHHLHELKLSHRIVDFSMPMLATLGQKKQDPEFSRLNETMGWASLPNIPALINTSPSEYGSALKQATVTKVYLSNAE